MFEEPIRRVDTVRYGKQFHHYVDANNVKLDGVTTVLGNGMPKPALIAWAGNTTAEYAVDHWDDLAALSLSERMATLKKCRYDVKNKAAQRGTDVHRAAERIINGESVSVAPELLNHAQHYAHWLDDFEVAPVIVEATVYNLSHGWAGTLDLIADLTIGGEVERWLLDIKTGKAVYGETAFQLAAYRNAEAMLVQDTRQDMIPVDRVGVVHVTEHHAQLVPVLAGAEQYNEFRHIQRVARAAKNATGYVLEPVA